ncbi:hypothetical protein MTR_7g027075 [Medicago truncatula]|uniref:Uncharacterized protein n=1 Tax=Medicago truncatula TaxID=3880 RepID=A0A072TWS0_MEDTR|nr:hypothetical protein MTR_7g027075 [Medicago truncatula]
MLLRENVLVANREEGCGCDVAGDDGYGSVVTPSLGGHVTPEADEGGEWSGSWHASRQN